MQTALRIRNAKVVGSTPIGSTNSPINQKLACRRVGPNLG
jgi:hypothetical protein